MTFPFVYINGYPGVGKFSVAKSLANILDNSKILDNHRLIDPVACVFERSMPEYQPLRKIIRNTLLQSIAESESTASTTWIFTDQQSSDQVGSETAHDYYRAAILRGSPFISIILTCDLEENLKRLVGQGRGGVTNTKLTDANILKQIRKTEDIHHFGGELEFELDVSQLSAEKAAMMIADFIRRQLKLKA